MTAEPLIRAEKVERIFEGGAEPVHALKGVDLEIREGKITVIMGRSGSGKTTLLNILGGLDRPTSGRVFFKGKDMTKIPEKGLTLIRRKEIGFIFQSFALMHLLTAFENVELILKINGVPWHERKKRVNECLRMVGLEKRAKHRIHELSGGEQQRVAIARAVASRPSIILADEPTAEVDTETARRIMNLFRYVIKNEGVTFCMVTHDNEVAQMADVVYYLEDGILKKRGEQVE